MRRSLALALALFSLAPAAHGWPSLGSTPPADRTDDKPSALQLTIDKAKVDLPGHKLEAKLSRACDKVRIKVVGTSGSALAEVEKSFGGAAAGTALAMSWTPSSEEVVAKIEVWGYDTDGHYVGVAITPWSTNIDHDELNFETDSDVIRPAEVPKLDATLAKIKDLIVKSTTIGSNTSLKPSLFIRGHTDTVGTDEHNLGLSRRRARAIAAWFKGHGIKIPIGYEGIGKLGLLVKTADQVDEPKNRRIVYIMAYEPPALPTGEFSWKQP